MHSPAEAATPNPVEAAMRNSNKVGDTHSRVGATRKAAAEAMRKAGEEEAVVVDTNNSHSPADINKANNTTMHNPLRQYNHRHLVIR